MVSSHGYLRSRTAVASCGLLTASLAWLGCSLLNSPDDPQPLANHGGAGGTTPTTSSGGDGGTTTTSSGGGGGGCAGGLEDCGGECVNLDDDPLHCGDCTTVCDEICVDGECACENLDHVLCDELCVDPLTDADHCGASGDCIDPNAGESCVPALEECVNGSCQCVAGLVECDGACIDPLTDRLHCGASGTCAGLEAGEACSPSAACHNGGCVDTCVNCSFETGDFTGWTTKDMADPYHPLGVYPTGWSLPRFPIAATDGTFALGNGYDGCGPDTYEAGQDVTIADLPAVELRFDYRCSTHNFAGAALPRTFQLHVEPAGGGPPLESVLVLESLPGTDVNTGPLTGSVDLSAYANQTVYLHFEWWVPECYTGPASCQLDNVRLVVP